MTARSVPPASRLSEPFWVATRDRRLVVAWCADCGGVLGYPRERCPSCGGSAIEWRPASGRGRVVAATTVHRNPDPAWAGRAPYTVCLVELTEGPRLLSSPPLGHDQAAVDVGTAVEVAWEPLEDGRAYPWFRPVPGEIPREDGPQVE
jgi:hypothetical protein